MREKTYTLRQIKEAFWKEFHKSGEQWFSYFDDSEEENESCTNSYWEEFVEELEKIDK
jgi:hypothetical protein